MGNPYASRKKSNNKKTSTPLASVETAVTPPTDLKAQEPVKEVKEPEKAKLEVPEATMEGILDWVGEDRERAAAAIEHEKSQPKPRKTLISKLGDI